MTFPLSAADAFTDPDLFGPHFAGASWRRWSSFLATFGGDTASLDPDLAQVAASCTERGDLATLRQAREAWVIAGRRSGKSRVAAMLATWAACFADWRAHLAPGEIAVVAVVAADRQQARVLFRYIRALILETPPLRRMVVNETAERMELSNRAAVEVMTASAISVRGRTLACGILDEVAFWPIGDAAQPDIEVLNALRPALASLPGSFLLAITSPYGRAGEAWNAFRRHFGRDGAPVLVWRAATLTMNPTIPPELVDAALEEDQERAGAEWLAVFRKDVERFVSLEAIAACTVPGRFELPRLTGVRYHGFTDPSGGSQDSFTLAISHREGERAVLDLVREVKPPFDPERVVNDYAAVLKDYGITRVMSDKYAGAWVFAAFHKAGIFVDQAARPKSEIYGELLPGLNSGKVELLDNQRLLAQLGSLERRTSRAGRDSIDHGPGAHDDLINSAAGALTMALARPVLKVDFSEAWLCPPSTAMAELGPPGDWRSAFGMEEQW